MADLNSVESIRALSQSELNKLNKDQLKNALQIFLATPPTIPQTEEPSNTVLLNEIKNINEKLGEFYALKEQVKCLTEKLNSAQESISQLHSFTEYLEGKERRKNIVVYGLTETPDTLGNNDLEKFNNILSKVQCNDIDSTGLVLKRLGDTNKPNRPLHVTLHSQLQRDKILRTSN